jgi:hypothetical protein
MGGGGYDSGSASDDGKLVIWRNSMTRFDCFTLIVLIIIGWILYINAAFEGFLELCVFFVMDGEVHCYFVLGHGVVIDIGRIMMALVYWLLV